MSPVETISPSLLEQASLWWVRLRDDDVPPEEIGRWLDWCQQDPAHLQAFEKIESLGGRLGALDASSRAELVRELLQDDKAAPRSAPRRSLPWVLALAAGVAGITLAVGSGLWRPAGRLPGWSGTQTVSYVTPKAQSQEVSLADGSHVAIGADSSLAVHYTAASRDLQLRSGEAYFEVQHNPNRPFVVQAGRLKVTAVGTAFNIRKTGDKVEVIVTRGVVDVADGAAQASGSGQAALPHAGVIRVAAGQLVAAEHDNPGLTVRPADGDTATSWRNGSMSFLDEDLAVVVANLNRYSQREVRIADPSLDHLRFTGSLLQGHEQEWLAAIQKVFPVVVRQAGGDILLYRRGETPVEAGSDAG
jgi:transmembrane sensor